MGDAFKICPVCSKCWPKMTDLIQDRDLVLNGYQASFNDEHEGLFLFTHNEDSCGTTLAIWASELKSLYDGPAHKIHMAFTEKCDGHCMYDEDLGPCTNDCDMKWARDIIQILKNHGPEEFLKKLAAA